MIFCSFGLFMNASCIFPMACANAARIWAIKLFYPLLGRLFPSSPLFIFGGLLRGWLGGWLEGWLGD